MQLTSRIFVAGSLMAMSLGVNASSFNLEMGNDEQGSSSSAVAVDISMSTKRDFLIGAGSTEVPATSTTLNSNFLYFGLRNQVSNSTSVTGMLEFSGVKGSFTMTSLSVPIRSSNDNGYFEFSPGFRNIRLTTTTKKQVLTTSTALGVKAGIYAGKHLRFGGSYFTYGYTRDVSKLSSFFATRYFNMDTLQLSSGLLKNLFSIDAGLDFEKFSVSVGKNTSISAIDNTTTEYVYTTLDYYISDRWGVGLLFGKYLNTPADQDNYTSVNLNYFYD